ncbi:MAG: DNA polymerase III subunit delta' [Candidatus Westeberhardia cardiocondylae]|nr:DNA polymerase III subunit delta' [Candidatus Westeberhardia cardiocondylae]
MYPWLTTTYEKIVNYYQNHYDYLPFLLHSIQDIGTEFLLREISTWLFCLNPNNKQYCNICPNCQLMKFNNYPDYYEIILDKNNKNNLENLYHLTDNIYKSPCYGKIKIISIIHSELLSKTFINTIKNIIHNPPKKTYFLFSCSQECLRLLSQLKNYCFYFFLHPPKEKISLYWLQKNLHKDYSSIELKTALRIYNGSPIQARNLLNSILWKKRKKFFAQIKKNISKKNFLFLLSMFMDKNISNELILWLLTILSDSVIIYYNQYILISNLDQLQLIQLFVKNFSISTLFVQWKNWLNCKRICDNVESINREMLFSHFLLTWQ